MSAAFQGFGGESLAFFKALAFHQTREWMAQNKGLYDAQVREPMAALLESLTARFAAEGLPLQGDVKRSMFRLNRDVRFAKDKSLYKTHGAAVLTRSGAKNEQGLVYFHLDPNGSFAAAGFYMPEPLQLAELRRDFIAREAAFRAIVEDLAGHGLAIEDDNPLTRNPRGYETVADPLLIAALRRRSHTVRRRLSEAEIFSPALVDSIARFAAEAAPFLRFGWAAIDRLPPQTNLPADPRRRR